MIKPQKQLYGINWKLIRHSFWQSETIQNRTYLLCHNEPMVYQEYHSTNFVFSGKWYDCHRATKMGVAKWVGLSSTEILELIKTSQYKVVPHIEFEKELWTIGENKRKGVKTQ